MLSKVIAFVKTPDCTMRQIQITAVL